MPDLLWSTPGSSVLEQKVLGVELRFVQDPSSGQLGTTVWDASVTFAKFLEKNVGHEEFSINNVKEKRVIELGAGLGLAGLTFALLGCKEVVLTDLECVLPLLRKNLESNLSSSAIMESPYAEAVGRVHTEELDWTNRKHCLSLDVPFDLVLACDCVYHKHQLRDLLATILAVSNEDSTVMMTNELRSDDLHHAFMSIFGEHFAIRQVHHCEMHPTYQHPALRIFILKRKTCSTDNPKEDFSSGTSSALGVPCETSVSERELREWETRRLGVEAARMLEKVVVPQD